MPSKIEPSGWMLFQRSQMVALEERNGREVKLSNCRRLWYWDGAASNFQLASEGVKVPRNCKFTVTIQEIEILDAIEIIPCTPEAIKSLESVAEWKS